ncbi:MAG: hypothetical protein FJ029_13310, partial [Actinobacteria bacterium]|nr:hypothetical protein [Actinomycetota bacterium]
RAAIRISELNVVANRALIADAVIQDQLARALAEMRSARDRTEGIVEQAIAAMSP